jgi:hypothetical protein
MVTILVGCGINNMTAKPPKKIFELIDDGSFDDLSLTIYYINQFILTRAPLSVGDLINFSDVNKIFIDSSRLEEHTDLLRKLSDHILIPMEKDSYLDTRLCYIFESSSHGKIFEVAFGGVLTDEKGEYVDSCTFVNGIAVEDVDIFYDVIMPFLPEDAVAELELYLGRSEQKDITSS